MGGWSGTLDEDGPGDGALLAQTNSLRLIDLTQSLIDAAVHAREPAKITPEVICNLNRVAMDGLLATAGHYRDGAIVIENSKHVPPPHGDLPRLMQEMCAQLDVERARGGEVWVAAFALWRLNWIHPFEDGNGRVARSLTHLLLSVDLQLPRMPGRRSLPDRILGEKIKYWRCLEAADSHFRAHRQANVQHLQGFLEKHLRALLREGVPEL